MGIFHWLSMVFFVVPGLWFPRKEWESTLSWLGLRIVLSVGANGVFFLVLRSVGVFNLFTVIGWLLVCWGLLGLWVAERKYEMSQIVRPRSLYAGMQLAVGVLFAGLAAYWSWFFPPELWDSLFYHLPLGRIIASDQLFYAYWQDPGRHGLLLRGASGMNLLPLFLSGFLELDSPLYRLAPPAISFAFLASVAGIVSALDGSELTGLGAMLAAGLAPGVLMHASDYYADLSVAAFVGFAFVLGLRSVGDVEEKTNESKMWEMSNLQLGLAAVCLFAAMPKRSGVLALGIPVLIAGSAFFRDESPISWRSFGQLASTAVVPLALISPYLWWKSTLPVYPGNPGTADLWQTYRQLFTQGWPRLFDVGHLESLGPHVTTALFVVFGLWILRLFRHRSAKRSLVPVFILCWYAACLYGIWQMNKLKWFNHWMRYVLPVQGLVSAWVALSIEDLLLQPPDKTTLHTGHEIRRWSSRLVGFAIVALFVWWTPWGKLSNHAFNRFGAVSAKPFASAEKKRHNAKWGGAYFGYHRADKLADDIGGNILSADTRIWYLLEDERMVYDTWSVPESADSVESVMAWLRERNIKVLIEDRARGFLQFSRADSKRGTAINDAVQSNHIERVGTPGIHGVYRVKE